MGITDVFKKSILEGFNIDIGYIDILATFSIALALSVFIYIVYRLKTKSQFYSADFNNSLLILPIVTAGIVLAIQSNIVISLGMVGALSIVRFRNAVKNTIDLMFLFWAISVGIIIGANLYSVAAIMSLIVTITLFLVDLVPLKKAPYLLVLNFEKMPDNKNLIGILKACTTSYSIKSRSLSGKNEDFIIEIRCKDTSELINKLRQLKTLKNINLLQHDGTLRI